MNLRKDTMKPGRVELRAFRSGARLCPCLISISTGTKKVGDKTAPVPGAMLASFLLDRRWKTFTPPAA